MKEIKFRAKHITTGDWIYGTNKSEDWDTRWATYSLALFFEQLSLDFKTLCQYIGLKDKNGKEIYEGDIVKLNNRFLDSIVFCGGMFTFKHPQAENRLQSWNTVEVIGNIMENPELLEAK